MKKLKSIFLLSVLMVLCAGCQKNQVQEKPVPTVSVSISPDGAILKVGEILQFNASVQPENATDQNIAWSVSNADIIQIDENGLLKALSEGEASVFADCAGIHQEVKVTVEVSDPATKGVKMINTTKVLYYGDRKKEGIFNYFIGLGDSEFIKDEEGDDAAKEGGMIVFMDIFSSIGSESFKTAELPEGTYVLDGSNASGTMNNYYTRQQINVEGKQVSVDFKSGELKVTRKDKNYLLEGSFVFSKSGDTLDFYYEGPLVFGDPDESSEGTFGDITDDQDLVFKEASGIYKGDPFSCGVDNYLLQFSEPASEQGAYTLFVDLMAKASSLIMIPSGTYTVSDSYNSNTAVVGEFVFGYSGTYCAKIDNEGKTLELSLITSGTIEVSETDLGYLLKFDLKTDKGVSIKGIYDGYFDITDESVPEEEGPFSTLTGDYQTDLSDAECMLNYYGDYYNVGLDSWFLQMEGSKDAIGIDLLTEATSDGKMLPDGRYNMSVENGVGFLKGTYNSMLGMLGTWWVDASSADGETATSYAPAVDGWVDIKTNDDGTHTIEFQFVDDVWNLIVGQWTGTVPEAKNNIAGAVSRRTLIDLPR